LNPTDVVGRRVGAYVIDTLIGIAIVAAGWFAFTITVPGACIAGGIEIGGDCRGFETGGSGQGLWALTNFVSGIVLWWILPAFTGVTPGKAIMGIKIVDRNGQNPGLGKVFVRNLMFLVDAFPYFIPNLVGFIVALNDKEEHKRLGDRVANTLVVDKSAAGQPIRTGAGGYAGPPPANPQAFSAGPPAPPQAPPPAPAQSQPAGWYEDPQRQARLRYWDGSAWTQHTSA
jgi:uncharacterized RDD family membrane protein YckC